MDIFNAGMQPFFDKRLDRREVELRHLIDSTNEQRHEVDEAGPQGVVDFKDAAQEQALATTDGVMAEHAVQELEEVIAARRRLADHDYGLCADCGAAIDLGRLWPWPQRLATPHARPFASMDKACRIVSRRAHSRCILRQR